ncbi:MucR family transcriptional regulator [Methylobacterium sp. J-076]|uniref:MucR family transcriptional regulator n=1 Tax=Methylobacterium sp. J-076 TaxID=2836655 RepID=UPI001FBA4BC8|nr:MucR family transcriptional regulator [Methylobacterium sp. J-076]MCJ2014283.1 MucR family transcriptional regulator [Methylobacterium sp. J-076]
MTGQADDNTIEFIEMTGEIVAAYVSHNHVAAGDLPALIATVHASLAGFGKGGAATKTEEPSEKLSPAQIRKSVQPEGIVSFIDGKTYKTLKRHLTSHGLDPDSYRERFGLPADYPMVALAYSEKRSSLAKSLGLGRPGDRAAPKGRRKVA